MKPERRLPGWGAARFVTLVAVQAHRDGVFLTASALAYISILSFIPLLAASSFIGERLFAAYRERLVEILSGIAPYAEQPLLDQINQFLAHAESLRGVALLLFISTAVFLFITIEHNFNRVWKISRGRPFKVRLVSFLLLVLWGPVAVGATFSSLSVLRESPWLAPVLGESAVWSFGLFLIKLGALTMLYWLVPHTRVRLRCALAGGLTAALALEALGKGFEVYAGFFRSANLVYGSFSFALFFAVSLQLTWTIVLIGSEIAYTAQHFRSLSHRIDHRAPPESSWVGLAALAVITRRFAAGEPIVGREALAAELRFAPPELDRAVHPLLAEGLLREAGGEEEGYLLARDPHRLPLAEIFALYERRFQAALEPLDETLGRPLLSFLGIAGQARREALAATTLMELVAQTEPGEASGEDEPP